MTRHIAKRNRQGFTLVEILIVVAIISILILLSLPGLQKSRASSYEASAIKGLQTLRFCFEGYYRDRGFYPAMGTTFSTNFFSEIQGYLPPESYQAGLTDQMAKGYELRARTDTFPGAPTDPQGRILGSHIFTIGAFPVNPEMGLRTFYIEVQGTVTEGSAFNNL